MYAFVWFVRLCGLIFVHTNCFVCVSYFVCAVCLFFFLCDCVVCFCLYGFVCLCGSCGSCGLFVYLHLLSFVYFCLFVYESCIMQFVRTVCLFV